MTPILPISVARVFVDGIFSEPRIAHPEGVAVHPDGSIWCGTETGDLLRVEADGSAVRRMASTGGFLLGLAFDGAGNAFVCDLRHAAIFRYDAATGGIERFADAGIGTPNYPVVDEARGWLYVSDSHRFGVPGGGVYRYDLATGQGGLWYSEPMQFANGMAMAPDRSGLYVVESTASRVALVPIAADGSPGRAEIAVEGVVQVPDGLAFAPDGTLYISCYEPSRIWRKRSDGPLELLIEDPNATVLAHPTNIALKGDRLYTSNLGRWHLSVIELG